MLGNNIQLDSARKVQPHQDVVKDGETQIDENEHTLVVFQCFPGFMWVTTGPLIWESLLRNGCLLADHDKKNNFKTLPVAQRHPALTGKPSMNPPRKTQPKVL
jgi:hypothetical protein